MPGRPNPFTESSDAERYQTFRPVYHKIPIQHLVGLRSFCRALDVACGTGHSTEALVGKVEQVVGCDQSEAMLVEARKRVAVPFVVSRAESLTFDSESFDLVHMSMAFHWVDQRAFLSEAARVLVPGGYLSLDNYGFKGAMIDMPEFAGVHAAFYRENLPPASRGSAYPDDALIYSSGFRSVESFQYDHLVDMDLTSFIGFITTQSNFLVLTDERKAWVVSEMERLYAPLFGARMRTLSFGGEMKVYVARG